MCAERVLDTPSQARHSQTPGRDVKRLSSEEWRAPRAGRAAGPGRAGSGGRRERRGASRAVVETVDGGDALARLLDGRHDTPAAGAAVGRAPEAAAAVRQHPADLAGLDGLGEPGASTSLSRPEKPPMATTSAPDSRLRSRRPDWLETATVPPPCALRRRAPRSARRRRRRTCRRRRRPPGRPGRRRPAPRPGPRRAGARRRAAPRPPCGGAPPKPPAPAAAGPPPSRQARGRRAAGRERPARRVAERLHRPGGRCEQERADRRAEQRRARTSRAGDRERGRRGQPAGHQHGGSQPSSPGRRARTTSSVATPAASRAAPASGPRARRPAPAPSPRRPAPR